jgi:hypothetical protein
VRGEGVAMQLLMAPTLAQKVLERVPARGRAIAADGEPDPSWWERLLYRDAWRTMREGLDRTVAASDLPEPDREEAFEEAERMLERRLSFMAHIVVPVRSQLKFVRRMENVRRRLDALVLVAAARSFRAERGAWPRGVAELRGARLLDAAEAARAEAELEGRGDGLALRASLLRPGPDDPATLTLLASAPPRAAAPSPPARRRAPARR